MEEHVFITTNRLREIVTNDIYNLLNPIHISILILSRMEDLKSLNVVSKLKRFLVGVPELGNLSISEIIGCYHDCEEFGLLNRRFVGDWFGFVEYVEEGSPLYLKKLLKRKKL